MRVHVNHRERRTGVFGRIHQIEVAVRIEFTEEERLIIRTRQLEDFIVLERLPDSTLLQQLRSEEREDWAPTFHLRIRQLLCREPDRFVFDTPSDAKIYQSRLIEALADLRAFIAANAQVGRASTLEL